MMDLLVVVPFVLPGLGGRMGEGRGGMGGGEGAAAAGA